MSVALPRKIVSNLKINEISSVDRPAQAGAVSVLLKSASEPEYEAIVKSASSVAAGAKPAFALVEYENALLRRAELLASVRGITPEKALAMSLSSDSVLRDLAHAAEVARVNAYGEFVQKKYRWQSDAR